MATKITIQAGEGFFKFKDSSIDFFESRPQVYQLERYGALKKDEAKIPVIARNIHTGDFLFQGVTVDEIEVDGVTHQTYEDLSAALATILFNKGGGSGTGGTLNQNNIPNIVTISLDDIGMTADNTEEEIQQALSAYIEGHEIQDTELYEIKLIGFPDASGGDFIPLTGTEEGKPVTGDIIIDYSGDYSGLRKIIDEFKSYCNGFSDANYPCFYSYTTDPDFRYGILALDPFDEKCLKLTHRGIEDFKGIIGSNVFDKQGDRLAFAQLSDVYDSNSYSTTETKTGGTWIDGKPIYRKVIEVNDFGSGAFFSYVYDNTFKIIESKVLLQSEDQDTYIQEFSRQYNPTGSIGGECLTSQLSPDTNEVYVLYQLYDAVTEEWLSILSNNTGLIIIEYTKTTD